MRITKLFSQMICCGAFSGISVFAFAQEPLTRSFTRTWWTGLSSNKD